MSTKKAKTIQICGTGSGVGKSVIVAGLCRIFTQKGYKVAPFKAQNMSLNSAVTPDGLEIGRAQAMQAAACGIEPHVDMNPVLLKPTSHVGSQVIVGGRPVGNMKAAEYYKYKKKALGVVKRSLENLMRAHDIVVIEGAGSPAEINLKKQDIVNMRIAKLLKCPVLIIGDIDCGGVFAWLHGTLDLLDAQEKKLVKGFIINKFRGDKGLLSGGLRFIERKTGKKVVGVVPYYKNIKLPEEDSLYFSQKKETREERKGTLKIVVVHIPHISNFTDFDVFEKEADVDLKYSQDTGIIKQAHCVIIPGSKNTAADLKFLIDSGIAGLIRSKADRGDTVIGICGGYQMLGRNISDTHGVENKTRMRGLGLLDMTTSFAKEKATYKITALEVSTGLTLQGYEIHHGLTKTKGRSLFLINRRGQNRVRIKDGTANARGNVWGTYIHGVFDNYNFRRNFIDSLRRKYRLKKSTGDGDYLLDREFDRLADLLKENINMKYLEKMMGL